MTKEVGCTTDGIPVIPGAVLFKLRDSQGYPLTFSLKQCEDSGVMVDWCGYVDAARQHGWSFDKILFDLIDGLEESNAYPDKQEEIITRIRKYIEIKEKQ